MSQIPKSAAGRRNYHLLLALLLSGNMLFFYALPAKISLVIFLLLAVTYYFIGSSNVLLVTFGLVASTVFLEAILQMTLIGDAIYYRPHERFSIMDEDLGHRRYKTNVDYEGLMPHGDLRAFAVSANVDHFILRQDAERVDQPVQHSSALVNRGQRSRQPPAHTTTGAQNHNTMFRPPARSA